VKLARRSGDEHVVEHGEIPPGGERLAHRGQ
jgi:hypothetical protein